MKAIIMTKRKSRSYITHGLPIKSKCLSKKHVTKPLHPHFFNNESSFKNSKNTIIPKNLGIINQYGYQPYGFTDEVSKKAKTTHA